jgi:hypothetical protein
MHLLEPGTAYSPGKQELQTDMPELLASDELFDDELFPPEFAKIESGKVPLLNFPPGQFWQMSRLCEGFSEVTYFPGPQTEQCVAPGSV